MYERRCNVVKSKLTDTEYKKLIELLKKSGARNQSEFLRERILAGYKSPEEMANLINYIVSEERHAINGLVGGNMIFTGTPETVYQQMMDCKQYFHKVCGRYMRHIIVSFSNDELQCLGVDEIYKIAMQICNFFR